MPITSSREREENKKYAAPPTGRDYPPTATGSAWVDYSILCRIWQDTGGTDCHVGALPLLAMTGRGIDKDLKAGIIINEGRALPVNGGPSSVTRSNRGLGASAVTSFYYLPG